MTGIPHLNGSVATGLHYHFASHDTMVVQMDMTGYRAEVQLSVTYELWCRSGIPHRVLTDRHAQKGSMRVDLH